jgi:TetR/AcrR family transcriptional regulator, mexJK operon transcriptional repressor
MSSDVLAAARKACSGGRQPTMAELAAAAGVSLRTLYRLFGSRQALLRAVDSEPPATARDRITAAALELVGRHGLADFSMDDVALAAGMSRATLYRLFPGKPALFRELVRTYSPWESLIRVLETTSDRSPSHVIPELTRALVNVLTGRTGLLLRMVSEVVDPDPDTSEDIRSAMTQGFRELTGYLSEQMAAGHLRRMHPVVAFQLLAGPIVAHLLTQPLAAAVGLDMSQDEVVDDIVRAWLRAMAPDKPA